MFFKSLKGLLCLKLRIADIFLFDKSSKVTYYRIATTVSIDKYKTLGVRCDCSECFAVQNF